MNQSNAKQIHVAGAKRGKTRVSKSRLLWFISQLQSIAMQNQSYREITFDTQLKTALRIKTGVSA